MTDKTEELLKEADRLAAEVEADLADHKFDDTIDEAGGTPELTPDMLANMDPVQLQQMIAKMAEQRKRYMRPPQSFFTRKQVPHAVRKQKRKAAKKARAITSRNGNGKCIPRKKRRKNAA